MINEKERKPLNFEYEVRGAFLDLYFRTVHDSTRARIEEQEFLTFVAQVPFKDGVNSSVSEAVEKNFVDVTDVGFSRKYVAKDIHSEKKINGVYIHEKDK